MYDKFAVRRDGYRGGDVVMVGKGAWSLRDKKR